MVRTTPSAPGAGRSAPGTLRLATYNIQLGRHLDRVEAVVRRAPALAAADILALQEADEAAVERLAGSAYAYAYYASARHPSSNRNFGPAILSRWPILDHGKVILPSADRGQGLLRIAVWARLMVHGAPLHVYTLHLSTLWESTFGGQDAQARAVVQDASAGLDPVLVIGDLNRRGAARVFERGGYRWLTRDVGRTHLFWSFDHMFARGVALTRVAAGSVPDGLGASDHRAVFAEVGLAREADAVPAADAGLPRAEPTGVR